MNLGSAISNNRLNASSSTTLRGCKPWQMKFAVASTSCLCFTLSFKSRVDLASIPLIVSCVDVFHRRGTAWSRLIVTVLLLERTLFLSMTLLKVGLLVRGVARQHNDSPAKSTNGLLVCNRASIVCGKTKVLPDSALCLDAGFTIDILWFHNLVEFVHS